jgi:hypothetical protein
MLLDDSGEPIVLTLDGEGLGTLTFEPAKDEPPIDVTASPRLQEILEASLESYRKHGGIPLEELREKVRQWEIEESSAS